MGRDAAKACENQCFRCRKEAAKHNDKLGSREGAAELLGISVSSLADYELGNTKVIPVDKVVLMADIYNAPELMAWYCSSECLIGKSLEMPSPEIASVERTTMKLLKQLRQGDIEQVKEKLIDITADGIISKDEWADLTEILDYLDGLIRAARELKLIGSKLLNGAQTMADIQTLKKLLAEEYGITTARELDEAMKKIGRLNIGVFASPVRKDGTKHEKVRSIARAG